MLDLANVVNNSDDFFVQDHDGYSVVHDQSVGGPNMLRHANSVCKSKGKRSKRNQSALSDKSSRKNKIHHHKKTHKKKHRK